MAGDPSLLSRRVEYILKMADAPDKTWAKAEITGVRSVESDQLGRPSSIHLTAVIFNGREIE